MSLYGTPVTVEKVAAGGSGVLSVLTYNPCHASFEAHAPLRSLLYGEVSLELFQKTRQDSEIDDLMLVRLLRRTSGPLSAHVEKA